VRVTRVSPNSFIYAGAIYF